jgi:hypothetical protein
MNFQAPAMMLGRTFKVTETAMEIRVVNLKTTRLERSRRFESSLARVFILMMISEPAQTTDRATVR